jgi:hypothetical protein
MLICFLLRRISRVTLEQLSHHPVWKLAVKPRRASPQHDPTTLPASRPRNPQQRTLPDPGRTTHTRTPVPD